MTQLRLSVLLLLLLLLVSLCFFLQCCCELFLHQLLECVDVGNGRLG
jgi:hypothetical protein